MRQAVQKQQPPHTSSEPRRLAVALPGAAASAHPVPRRFRSLCWHRAPAVDGDAEPERPLPPHASARSAFLLACSLPTRRRLGPKRASKIRKLFALSKDDDVRKYVIRRELPSKTEGKKGSSKAPKIQRLVTPQLLQRKRDTLRFKKIRQAKAKVEAADYQKLLSQRQKEVRDKKMEKISQRKSARSSRASEE